MYLYTYERFKWNSSHVRTSVFWKHFTHNSHLKVTIIHGLFSFFIVNTNGSVHFEMLIWPIYNSIQYNLNYVYKDLYCLEEKPQQDIYSAHVFFFFLFWLSSCFLYFLSLPSSLLFGLSNIIQLLHIAWSIFNDSYAFYANLRADVVNIENFWKCFLCTTCESWEQHTQIQCSQWRVIVHIIIMEF